MYQYLCQFCYRIVTYGEKHPCFFYKNDNKVYLLPRLDEMNKNHDDTKEILKENSAKFSSNVQENESEKPMHVQSQPIENKENLLFTSASDIKRKCWTNSKRTSKNAELRNPHDASLNAFKNVETDCYCDGDIPGAYKTSFVTESNYDQKESESKFYNLFHAKGIGGCGVTMEESKRQCFYRDKESFMDALLLVTKNAPSDNTSTSRTSRFLVNSDVLPLNQEPDNGMIEAMEDPKNNIPSEVHSRVQINSEELDVNENEPICSNGKEKEVAEPSRICPTKKNYACGICPKKFSYQSQLIGHYRMHTGEKPFVCDKCGKKFAKKGNHDTHYRIHTGEKPFVCDVCGKAFAQKNNLTEHIRTHTGEKPFVCDVCGKAFAQKSTLIKHIRTHRGKTL